MQWIYKPQPPHSEEVKKSILYYEEKSFFERFINPHKYVKNKSWGFTNRLCYYLFGTDPHRTTVLRYTLEQWYWKTVWLVFSKQFYIGIALTTIVFLLTACASGPAYLEQAKASVDSRYTYSYRMTSMVTERARPEDGTANCTKYALEYLKAVSRGTPIVCITPRGEKHRAVVVGDWVLDNRYRMVVPLKGYDCKLI